MTYIYALIDPRTQECKYVGKSERLKQRLQDHYTIKDTTPRYFWLQELRSAGLTPEVVILEEVEEAHHWQEYEYFWITYLRFVGAQLLNKTFGVTDDTKRRMSASRMGHAGYMAGKTHKEETKERIRQANLGRVSPMKGRTHSPETLEKMRQSQKARRSQEHPTK